MSKAKICSAVVPLLFVLSVAAAAQQVAVREPPAQPAGPSSAARPSTASQSDTAAPTKLVLYFATGSAAIDVSDQAVLDQASRTFREGHPVIMIVTGSTDTVGSPETNLILSQERADAVLRGLVARGIPADRMQLVAKGETELSVPTGPDVAQAKNRRAEITWHQ